jgi:hypothetical protein
MEKHNAHFQCVGHCMMITSPQLADRLGKSRKTVAMYCQKLGIPKLGSIYAMTEAQAAGILSILVDEGHAIRKASYATASS